MANRKLNNLELSSLSGQMAILLKSGISAVEGLTMLKEESESAKDQQLFAQLLQKQNETGHLYTAFEATSIFPTYFVNMCRIGEESGNLDEVMQALSTHYEQEESVHRSVQNAVIYPLIMTGMMLTVIIILLVNVMPVFSQVFEELGTTMSGFALLLYNLGISLRQYSIPLILLLIAFLCLFMAVELSEGRNSLRYKFGNKFKSIRRSNEAIAAFRFASGMAITLKSGLNPAECVELSEALIENPDYESRVQKCRKDVEDGMDLAEAFKAHSLFRGIYSRMASIGSRSGSLDEVMQEISSLYETEISNTLNDRLAVIEPTLIICLSVLVGAILLSVMFPLLSVMSTL